MAEQELEDSEGQKPKNKVKTNTKTTVDTKPTLDVSMNAAVNEIMQFAAQHGYGGFK